MTEETITVSKTIYFRRLEALDYIARYDVELGPDHAEHLRDVAKKALGRDAHGPS